MQLHIISIFALLVVLVAADGVRNGYERVWLWYAYQIDLTLPEDQRKIGVRCIEFVEKPVPGNCPPQYQKKNKKGTPIGNMLPNFEACKGSRPDKTCYFWEFMGHIDKKNFKPQNNWLLPTDATKSNDDILKDQQNLKPDPTKTANWLAEEHQPRPDNNPVRAVKYRPYRAFKGADNTYNDMLKAVGVHSTSTISAMSDADKLAHKDNIDAIKKSLQGVEIERKIDSSKWIIDKAKKENFKLVTRTEPGHTGDIVDWDKTRELPEHKSDPAGFTKFKDDFYGTKEAKEHEAVMKDFDDVKKMYDACG